MKNNKFLLVMIMSLFMFVTVICPISACTEVYVGPEVSEDGHTYFGRTEDVNAHTKRFVIYDHATHEEGEFYEDAYGFKMQMPEETLRFSVLEDSNLYGDGERPFGEAGFNEAGVALSATVTTFYNEAAEAADPTVEGGIGEVCISHVILGHATSAREGIEYLASIIAEKGAAENFNIMIADNNETWLFEAVAGHQWAAMKMPADKVAVIPNHIIMGTVDVNDTENYMVSPELVSLAEENGFLVEEDGLIHVSKSYSDPFDSYDSYRAWASRKFLNPSLDVTETDEYYDVLFDPAEKVSMMDIKNLLSIRYEDQEYSWNNGVTPENYNIRPIGVLRQAEVHLFDINSEINTQWQCMGPIEFSVLVPFYTRLMTDTPESMQMYDLEPVDGQYDWTFRTLGTLCALDREMYGANVRAYWDAYQEALIEANTEVVAKLNELYAEDPEAAEVKATELAFAISQEAYDRAEQITNELIWYLTAEESAQAKAAGKGEEVEPFMPSLLEEGIFTDYNFDMTLETETAPETVEPVETPEASQPSVLPYALVGAVVGAGVVYFVMKSKKTK